MQIILKFMLSKLWNIS